MRSHMSTLKIIEKQGVLLTCHFKFRGKNEGRIKELKEKKNKSLDFY